MTTPASTLPAPPPRPAPVVGPRSYQGWIWGGAALCVLGIASIIGWIVHGMIDIDRTVDDLVRATEGSVTEFSLDSPRSWTVYVEPRSESIAGLRFGVVDATGERVPMQSYDGDVTYSVTGHSGRAVATISLEAGTHRLVVDGGGSRSIAIGPSVGGRIVGIILGSILIGIPLIGGGATLLILGALRQSRARNRSAPKPPPSMWSAGEWPGSEPRAPAQ